MPEIIAIIAAVLAIAVAIVLILASTKPATFSPAIGVDAGVGGKNFPADQ